jgi:hypothetical protein
MDTHFFGTLAVTRAFAPQLAAHGSSPVLNILSVLSWLSIPRSGAYCAAKSAEWSLTNALRLELVPQGTRVTALHVAYMDTDMTRRLDVPKSDPAVIAKLAIDGIQSGDAEIIADDTSGRVLAGLSAGVAGLYPRSPDLPGESMLRELLYRAHRRNRHQAASAPIRRVFARAARRLRLLSVMGFPSAFVLGWQSSRLTTDLVGNGQGPAGAAALDPVPGRSRRSLLAGPRPWRRYRPDRLLPDQAAIYGVLAAIESLGLELFEARRMPPG